MSRMAALKFILLFTALFHCVLCLVSIIITALKWEGLETWLHGGLHSCICWLTLYKGNNILRDRSTSCIVYIFKEKGEKQII